MAFLNFPFLQRIKVVFNFINSVNQLNIVVKSCNFIEPNYKFSIIMDTQQMQL